VGRAGLEPATNGRAADRSGQVQWFLIFGVPQGDWSSSDSGRSRAIPVDSGSLASNKRQLIRVSTPLGSIRGFGMTRDGPGAMPRPAPSIAPRPAQPFAGYLAGGYGICETPPPRPPGSGLLRSEHTVPRAGPAPRGRRPSRAPFIAPPLSAGSCRHGGDAAPRPGYARGGTRPPRGQRERRRPPAVPPHE